MPWLLFEMSINQFKMTFVSVFLKDKIIKHIHFSVHYFPNHVKLKYWAGFLFFFNNYYNLHLSTLLLSIKCLITCFYELKRYLIHALGSEIVYQREPISKNKIWPSPFPGLMLFLLNKKKSRRKKHQSLENELFSEVAYLVSLGNLGNNQIICLFDSYLWSHIMQNQAFWGM